MQKINYIKGKRVAIGMSGGVDSSLSAYLLKRAGALVTGVFIDVWQPDWIECTSKKDRYDAMRVASSLGIRFETIDLKDTYKKEVVDYMINEYREGRTPNPDIMCNTYVKFGSFYRWAIDNGFDYVATGHYAISKDSKLYKSKDQNKDQTYFLSNIKKVDMNKIVFPIGDMTKEEVRKMAEKEKIYVAHKKDSQGLCFIGKVDFKEFLIKESKIDIKEGGVLDNKGNIIGTHKGAIFYTIGERHGFDIKHSKSDDKPLYVISKDIEKNTITVEEKKDNGSLIDDNMVKLNNINWISYSPKIGEKVEVRFRYREPLKKATIEKIETTEKNNESIILKADSVLFSNLVSGQHGVMYIDNVCIGGGIIE